MELVGFFKIGLKSYIIIGSDGAVALAEMLVENNYLQELDISQNEIEKSGCDALFSMLLENTTIQKLVLDRCKLNNDCISGMIVPLAQAHKVNVTVQITKTFSLIARRVGAIWKQVHQW